MPGVYAGCFNGKPSLGLNIPRTTRTVVCYPSFRSPSILTTMRPDASSCSAPSLLARMIRTRTTWSPTLNPRPDEKNRPDYPTFLTAHHMQAAMWAVFPTDLAEHGMNEIKDALEYDVSMWRVKGTKEPEDPNKIVFHPTLVHAAATEIFTHLKDGKGALRYRGRRYEGEAGGRCGEHVTALLHQSR